MLPAEFHQACHLAGIGLARSKDIFHTVLLQAEIAAQIGKSGMACNKVPAGKGPEFFPVRIRQLLETGRKYRSVLPVICRICRIRLRQSLRNGGRLLPGTGRAQPGMGIILAMFPDFVRIFVADGFHIPGSHDLDHFFVFRSPDHFFGPGLHPKSLADKDTGPAQRLHALCRRLEIVRFRAFRNQHSHPDLIASDAFRQLLHGIKTGDYGHPAVSRLVRFFTGSASCQKEQAQHTQNKESFLHCFSL